MGHAASPAGTPDRPQTVRSLALNELAGNLQATIEHLNAHRSQVHSKSYQDYAAMNADLAESLAHTISDFVKYAQIKTQFEALSQKLELPISGQ
ncbi:MAG: hypothetical protein JO182_17815 [Acidobacteriaceae bacterium]|nr:hypothetical protein [Acidobacteriaceae bacterium]MBV9223196.1 hypothetical protein [Acidobacteriaceae bacterium]MBV9306819.1 hypothetical protein [Acidobacteriaceae bacterium]MBV9939676.1 hypothetical protein [Acidobacteriaceae bacterium]